jgi:lipopolysaccharide export system protein LptA
MTGSSQGMTFRDLDDVMILPADVVIRVTPDAEGGGAIDMKAGSAEISRAVHTIHLAGGVTTSRPSGTTLSDTALARLTPEEDRLQALELRGQSRLASRAPEPGALQSVTGRDMDLAYGPDGQTLQRVVVMGDADLTIAGERGRTGRQLTTDRMTIALSANGTAPIGLTAQGRVRMSLPAEDGVPRRTIAAQDFTANGTEERGLTSGRFSGRVEFSERAARAERTATSETLELVLAGGLSAIEEARFAGSVQFLEGGTRASSARAVYRLRDGTLGLTGPPTPLVVRDQLTVQATRIDLNLEREQITASGAVKSELQPRKGRASETRLPSLLSDENPVSIFAERLAYEGTAGTALYTGNVRLVQSDGKGDDTAIKSETLTLDETSGNLIADGAVVTTVTLDQVRDDGRKERVLTTVRSSHLQYDDAARRAVYSGGAQLSSAEGDLTAARVEIFLLPEGRELDRMDAHEKAEMVASDKRRATGAQITYRANDRSYHVTGAPAVLSDACGDAEGRTITFFRATDRMIINGQEGRRSRTRGTAGCS